MSDYISKSALKTVKFHPLPYTHIVPTDADAESYKWGWNDAIDAIIEAAPTIDAVPVVRCKDCKHYREGVALSPQKFCFRLKDRDGEEIGYNFAEDDFCSLGERREDAD